MAVEKGQVDVTLADRCIRVRELRPFEEEPIRDLFDHLSLRTRYFRFLSPLRMLPDALLRRLACVDGRHLAFVAEHDAGGACETIALGSFGAVDDERVEVGLVVRDDWQRQHIGTELAIRVLDAAEARGYHRFIAHIAAGNVGIRHLLANVGEVVSATASFGTSELVFVRRRR